MVRMDRMTARLDAALAVTGVLIALGIGGGRFQAEAAPAPGLTPAQVQPILQPDPPCYFPLQVGNRWDYAMSQSPGRSVLDSERPLLMTVEIPTSYGDGERTYYQIDNFLFSVGAGPSYFFNDSQGQATELMGHETGVWYPWSAFGSGRHVSITLPSFGEDCIHGSRGHLVERRTVTVPAGTFENAAVIAYDSGPCADLGLFEEVLAPGVGLIRRSVGTIAGIRTWSLAYAHVGNRAWGSPELNPPLGADKTSDPHPESPVISTVTWGLLKSRFRE